jgi:hypothetical protein
MNGEEYLKMKFVAAAMGFTRSPPPYLSLIAMDANSSGEVMSNMMMAAASAMKGASFASGGSGVLDSTVRIKFSKTILILHVISVIMMDMFVDCDVM